MQNYAKFRYKKKKTIQTCCDCSSGRMNNFNPLFTGRHVCDDLRGVPRFEAAIDRFANVGIAALREVQECTEAQGRRAARPKLVLAASQVKHRAIPGLQAVHEGC